MTHSLFVIGAEMTMVRKALACAVVIAILLAPATAWAQDEDVVYFHTDATGSVRMVTSATGVVIGRYDFLPFGELWPTSPPAPTETRQFTGTERDGATKLDYFGARDYRAQSGRFITVDPGHVNGNIFDPQSWNAYAYVRNNPLKYVDPTGTTYEICGLDAYGGTGSCGRVSDQYFANLERSPGGGLRLWGGAIWQGDKRVGYYTQLSVDPTFEDLAHLTGALSSRWLREQSTQMAVGAAVAATGGLAAGALSGGLAAESLSITGGLAPLRYGKAAGKLARQMAARGWSDDMIREAVASGQKFQTINKATGNPAIRFVHPRTGQSVVIDTITKQIIHVGGRGFLY